MLFLLIVATSLVTYAHNKPTRFISKTYHTSSYESHLIALSLMIPYVIEVFFAVFAYLGMQKYSNVLDNCDEKVAFSDFRQGQFCIALYIGITPLLAGIFIANYTQSSHGIAPFTLFVRYANLAILVYAAILLYRSSTKFLGIINYTGQRLFLTTAVAFVGALVLFLVLGTRYAQDNLVHQQSLLTLVYPVSYKDSSLTFDFTFIIPRVIAWFTIVLAAQNFITFQRHVKGKFYKKAFLSIPKGILIILLSVAILRAVELMPLTYERSNPIPILLLSYCIGIIGVVGFWLYARGADKLYIIEKA